MSRPIDLSTTPAIHVIGCGGTGMAPLTAVLTHMGLQVSGSDQRGSDTLTALGKLGASITVGHDFDAIPADAVIVRSTAVPDDHPEVAAAKAAGRPVLRRADALAGITKAHTTVAIAGTHGKTTTSAMAVAALIGAGLPVTSIVGGRLLGLEQVVPGAVLGEPGGVLVVEADESDGTFVELDTNVAVVTNIEPDHLEYYGGEAGLMNAFDRFIGAGDLTRVVACLDDPGVRAALGRISSDASPGQSLRTYGETDSSHVRLHFTPPLSRVEVSGIPVNVEPPLPGRHNALNLTAALAVAEAMGVDLDRAAGALTRFEGVGRRFERRGVGGGVEVVDDYAHLHGEILAAIDAARQVCDGRVHVVFQPHRFSRTEALWETYAPALAAADTVVITDIYASGEASRPGIDSGLIHDHLRTLAPDLDVVRVGEPVEVAPAIASRARAGDLCLLLSAGDLPAMANGVIAALEAAS